MAKSKAKYGAVGLAGAVFMAIMAVAMLPTTLLICIGLIPSAVAFFVDSSKTRFLGPTVMALNVAGILPSLLKLWRQGHNVNTALGILMEPTMLLIILVPAAFGWLLFAYTPHVMSSILRRRAEMRIRSLERNQEELVEQWGPRVTYHANGGPPKTVELQSDSLTAEQSVSA